MFRSLLSMTGTHLIGGRAAGLTWGYHHNLPSWLVIGANMAIETFLVLLFYPLFVLSYRSLIVIGPLRDALERAQNAAEAQRGVVTKLGAVGLLLFVWFPFWMTGPLVGSVIGFLIGLPTALNLAIVLLGTYAAILCWGLVLQHAYSYVERLGPYVSFAVVAVVILLAVSLHIRRLVGRQGIRCESDQG